MQGNYLTPIIDAFKPILFFAAVLWGIETIITMLIKDHKKAKRKQAREKRRLEYKNRRMANDAEHAKVTRAMRYDVLRRDNFHCVRCGRGKEDGVKLHVDHIVPVSRGGKSVMGNLQTLCEDCNGNWGFLYDSTHDSLSIAPVYDCGSSLFPEADQTMQKEILHDKQALHRRLYSIPTSSIKINGKRINYFNFLSSLEYVGCNRALERMMPRIDMDKIENIILDTPGIDQAEKEFYTGILKARKENILDYSANQLSREKGAMTLTKELKRTVDRSLAAKEISSTEAAKKYIEVQNSQSGKDEILNEPNVKAADGSHFKGSSDNACL